MFKFHINQPIQLAGRALLYVSGADAATFLQGQISNDIDLLNNTNALHALILTPQGKILADLFIYNYENGYLLELDSKILDWLVSRLQMFKLRSDVVIENISKNFNVIISQEPIKTAVICAPDPRLTAIGQTEPYRNILPATAVYDTDKAMEYQQYLARQAIASFGSDYQASEYFPQDLWYEKLNSVSFSKGCYVGQEVVSRMRHKSTPRKRLLPLFSHEKIDLDQAITYNNKSVGQPLSQTKIDNGFVILAVMRMDKLPENNNILDGVEIRRPEWIS